MISEEQEVSLTTRKTKGVKGGGTIRQRPDGRWEARYTLGIDPGTGKQIQKSVYGKTQREVRQKLTAITAEIDSGTYQEPCKMTVNEWLDIWLRDYQIGVKDSTAYLYERQAKLYLRPVLGSIPLETLKAHTIQRLYNSLSQEHDGRPARNAQAIKYIVIHYTGNDGDTAQANAKYYASTVVKSSAHYFVDANSVYQSVPDLRVAWAVGGGKYPSCPQTGGGTLYNICRNTKASSYATRSATGRMRPRRRLSRPLWS